MDLLNKIVHNDDNRQKTGIREVKFGDYLTYSKDLDDVLTDIILDIKRYSIGKLNTREQEKFNESIDIIANELAGPMDFANEKLFPSLTTAYPNPKKVLASATASDSTASDSAASLASDFSAAAKDTTGRQKFSLGKLFKEAESSDDRRVKYPLICDYLRSQFPDDKDKASNIAVRFYENDERISIDELKEMLDYVQESQKEKLIGHMYDDEIEKLEKEIEKLEKLEGNVVEFSEIK
jgi:hypothetical protein